MPRKKIAITIDEGTLKRLEQLILDGKFPNRSRAIEHALRQTVERVSRTRLVTELSNLDPSEEQDLADEGLAEDANEWPEY